MLLLPPLIVLLLLLLTVLYPPLTVLLLLLIPNKPNIHSCKLSPSLYVSPRIFFDSTQRLHFSRSFCFSSKCSAFFPARGMLVRCLRVSSQRERQRHGDHGDRPRCRGRRHLHAFCSHGALLQVLFQNINTFLLPRKIFSTFPFLSPPAALTFFFLPDSFAESDHSQYPLVSIILLLF